MSGNAKKTFRGPQSSHDAFDSIVERARAMSGLNLTAADALVWLSRALDGTVDEFIPSDDYETIDVTVDDASNQGAVVVASTGENLDGYVYAISDGRYVKIGHSSDPDRRLRQLQTGSATELHLIAKWPGTQDDERSMHEKLAQYREVGEWFALPPREVAMLAQMEPEIRYVEREPDRVWEIGPPSGICNCEWGQCLTLEVRSESEPGYMNSAKMTEPREVNWREGVAFVAFTGHIKLDVAGSVQVSWHCMNCGAESDQLDIEAER